MRRRAPRRRALIGLAVCLLPLAGCAGGGSLTLAPPVAADWGDARRSSLAPSQDPEWWRQVGDPVLDQLVALALADSPDLAQTSARLDQARARMQASGAALGPQFGLAGQVNGLRLPPEVAESLPGLDPDIGQAQLQLQGGWELDFWGKASNAALADAFGHLGAQETALAARASLIGDLAAAYVELRVLDERLNSARAAQADRTQGLALARTRRSAGVADVGEVAAAEAEAAQQAAEIAALEAGRAQTRHAIALLVGRTEADIAPLVSASAAVPTAPAAPGAGLPADLLRNRPDVLQAEYAVLAQYARLESARADLYPSLSLSGALGASSSTLGGGSLTDLFNWDQRLLSAGLSLSMPLFNRGRLVAQVDLQDAALLEAVAGYEKAVLSAQRDVLDALAQDAGARDAAAQTLRRLDAQRRQTRLARQRRDAGVGLRADLLNADLAEQAAIAADAEARGDVLKAWIGLHRALGTGARAASPNPSSDTPAQAETPNA